MSFQWLQSRISEEHERRLRESQILEQLPLALEEVHRSLALCVDHYTDAFGPEAGDMQLHASKIRITVREEQDGKWEQSAKIEITMVPALPGLRIERTGDPLLVEVGMLPGDKLFYKDGDQYLTMDELTRRILDRAFFPKLKD